VIRPPGSEASLPAIDRAKLGLATGDPADATAILGAQDKLITELRKQGFAL
jgi:translocation and assembly module TamA